MNPRPNKGRKAQRNEIPAQGEGAESIVLPLPAWIPRDWVWGSILVLVVILVYSPVWWAGYIWDDNQLLAGNPIIVGPLGLKELWTTSAGKFCPLVFTTFWAEHWLWGLNPVPYHIVNVLWQAACAVLLWHVLRRLRVPGALLGAALWALHPVQVESVAWISEMKNTESGFFFLLTLLFYVRWIRPRKNGGRSERSRNYGLTLFCAALAMASKPSTVILPGVLALCSWWIEGRWCWRHLMKLAPIFVMSIIASVLTIWTPIPLADMDPHWVQTWPQRVAAVGDAVWFYLGKLVCPYPLITIYPRWEIDATQWTSYMPSLAVILVLVVLWHNRDSGLRPCFFIFSYFLLALLPVLGLVDNYIFRYSLVFDHFQYLASMGPLALAGVMVVRFVNFAFPGKSWSHFAIYAGVLLVLGVQSWQQARPYQTYETFWNDTLAKNPNSWVAHYNLGLAFEQQKLLDKAIIEYQKALEIYPNYISARNNLGNALVQRGQVDEARAQFQKTLTVNPNNAKTENNLGLTLAQQGRMNEAIIEYQKALEIYPDYAEAHYNLGTAFFQEGRLDEAIAEYQRAMEINPGNAPTHNNLGVAFSRKGQIDEGIAQFQAALEIIPNYAEAHKNLGSAFSQKGQLNEAIIEYQKALQIQPNYPEARLNLGKFLAKEGKFDEAIIQFQEVLQLQPGNVEAQMNLTSVQAMVRQKTGQK